MSISKRRDTGKWLARVIGADGKRRSRSFALKADAERWKREQLSRAERGENPITHRGGKTVAELGEDWLSSLPMQQLKPKTISGYERLWAALVQPRWGFLQPRKVQANDVRTWFLEMANDGGKVLSLSRRTQALQVLAMVLDCAVRDGLLVRNPARKESIGKIPKVQIGNGGEHRYLTAMELRSLAASADAYGDFVFFLGTTGLRFSEATALTIGDVNLDERRLTVSRSAPEVNGKRQVGPTKTGKSRSLILPMATVNRIRHLTVGREPDELLFVTKVGTPILHGNFRGRVWKPAIRKAALEPLRIHDLRHTAASLAVDSGANVKGVQEMLGHASAAMTLDRYAGLFTDHLEEVADRMDAVLTQDEWHESGTNKDSGDYFNQAG